MSSLSNHIGAVVIGRNEGVRLQRCLKSLKAVIDHVVYVDSGSTDDSLAIAAECGVESVSLDVSSTFSAGRARNVGFGRLMTLHPDLAAVQFVDGDCELDPNWIDAGFRALTECEDVAVVCGRRRERSPEHSLFNRLIDFEWETPIGESSASGGDFLIRAKCFQTVGGFNTQVVAGEEPELGFRLRRHGWKILRIDHEMTLHDAALTRFSSWWKRERRGGYGGLDVHFRTALDSQSYFAKHVRSTWFWSLGWLCFLCLMLVIGGIADGAVGLICGGLLWLIATMIQVARIALRYRRPQVSASDSFRLAALTLLSKWPQMLGQIAWFRDRWLGRHPRLIEYKPGPPESKAFAS
ncbi:MAG: glycosyltransferase [Planctomycetaceae bacterium]